MNMKRKLPLALVAAGLTVAMLLAGCQDASGDGPGLLPGSNDPAIVETTLPPAEPPTEPPTEPPATCPPDGNPDDVTCQGSYSGEAMEVVNGAKTTVATIGKAELDNSLLQIYYHMAVNAYRAADHEIAPDFTQPLDVQLCPLDGTAITWQQYFLEQALNTWRSQYAMVQRSKKEVLPLEEAYDRDEAMHAKNEVEKAYNLSVLYGYNTDYQINESHQAFLDDLPNLMEELAARYDCPTPAALTSRFAGIATNDTYLLEYAQLLNEGYMFMTTLSYYIEPTAEEVEAYYDKNAAAYEAKGITKDGSCVNLRHILVLPKDATVAEDGTVTASDENWEAARKEAEKVLANWAKDKTEANFAQMAFDKSADTGSSVNGGLYSNIAKGQLMEDLDLWCFDPARKAGDTVVIRTSLGYHVLYLAQSSNIWFEQAEKDLIAQLLEDEITKTVEKYPLSVDYSAIVLGEPTSDDLQLTPSDLLYPDIAHERFPKAPLYFQQDYPDTMYGNYPLVRYGCGVTTMAMLVSYMTDDEWTPPEMCELYGSYCGQKGTAWSMFTEVPVDRGFYCDRMVHTWSQALDALKDGYMVVTLQNGGYWTAGGHYLLLHNLIDVETDETDENGNPIIETKVQVWDSNVKNYKRLTGHAPGHFPLSTIPGNAKLYWVYQKKVMNVDSCVRCAEPTEDTHAPSALFVEDYVCPKCQTAVNRRDAYMDGCAVLRTHTIDQPEETPTEAPTETAPTEIAPAEIVPTETIPTDTAPTETAPTDVASTETVPAETVATEAPTEAASTEAPTE